MSVRKIVGLLAGFALAVGLIGAGVGAQFTSSVTAQENITVGKFECQISAATSGAIIAPDAKSVSYTAPLITSSTGSAPFWFNVSNTGDIADVLTVATSPVSPPWSIIGEPFAPVALGPGGTHNYNTGIAWAGLDNSNLNTHGAVTWTVSCNENGPAVIFDNHPSTLPSSLPSIGVEAYSFNEFGAQVQLAGSARKLTTATVTMVDWACETGGGTTCVTIPGHTFNVPIQFNVYSVGASNAVGSLIASVTQTFAIPYRPSSGGCPSDLTAWGPSCSHGLAANITFNFAGQTLPNNVIFGIAYNTNNHGYSPLGGTGSPTDSLNIGMYPGTDMTGATAVAPAVGSFVPNGLSAYLNDSVAGFYLDNGAGGTGSFRLDTGTSWNIASSVGPYGSLEPAVQIVASY